MNDRLSNIAASELRDQALWVRRQVLTMIAAAKKGHIGGSLSCTDILVTLYLGGVLNVRPREPNWADRDRLIFSKGHACEAFYATLARAGFIPTAWLATYGQDGSRLGGHPDHLLPGVEVSSGSLGHGLGQGAGMAYSARHQGRDSLAVVILGDGECYEGSIWEAAQFAAHHRLGRLVALVDRNREITLDDTEDCNRHEPFADKWRAFGWEVRECDGHDFDSILGALGDVRGRALRSQPLCLIARTIKGKGISFMEQEIGWHHNVPKGEHLAAAKRELGLD